MHSNSCDEQHIKNVYGQAPLATFNSAKESIIDLHTKSLGDGDVDKLFLPISHTFTYVKNENKAEIRAFYDKAGMSIKEVAVPKDINGNYPYGFKELKIKLSEEHPELKFYSNLLSDIRKNYEIDKKPEYYYFIRKNGTRLYSEAFYQFLVEVLKESQPQRD